MASIDQIIRSGVNPFDPATFKPGNFWQDQQPALTVGSIHQQAIAQIEVILAQVAKEHRTCLCQTKQIQLLDPKAKPEAQLICLVPTR